MHVCMCECAHSLTHTHTHTTHMYKWRDGQESKVIQCSVIVSNFYKAKSSEIGTTTRDLRSAETAAQCDQLVRIVYKQPRAYGR